MAALALYLLTISPTVLDGDSGEYQYMAYILGVPHSTGYPLYILLGKLFTFLPFGDVAYRINLFSAIFAALAVTVVYWTARRLVPRRIPALIATLIFAVTPSVWGSAVQAETYALHLFLGVLTILLMLRWHQEGQARDFYWFAFVCGLGLTHHVMYRFIAPAAALLLWFNRARLTRAMLARGVLLGLVPLLLYAYIPIRANQLIAQQDPANKALYGREDAMVKGTVTAFYNNSPEGFFKLVTGLDNIYKMDVKSPLDSANRLELSATLLLQQFGWAGLGLAMAGAWLAFRRERQAFWLLFAAAAGTGLVAFYLRGTSTVFYFSMTYFVLALWIAFGLDALMQWAVRARVPFVSLRVVTLVLLLLPLSALIANFPRLDKSNNYAPRDYAQAILRENLPPNAVVVAPWEVSQPLRYFQFVENQRPDLLVTNVSPIWPQFQKLLASARELRRPFYNVEFNPELPTAPGPRFAQAIPLPLMQEPQPRYTMPDARIVDGAQVIGYDLDPDPPQPGTLARVLIYYRALDRMYPMYSSALTINDITGKLWSDYYGFPGSQYQPTYRWQAGDVYREQWQFIWPADAPSGLYNFDLSWYVYDLDTRKSDFDHENKLALGVIRVGNLTTNTIGNPKLAQAGQAISFLGWDSAPASNSDTITAARGSQIALDLYWRSDRELRGQYTVFVHLVDTNGRVIADADSPPSSGLFPTDRWTVGEVVRDRHTLQVPSDLAPGDYAIEIGMYLPSTGKRLLFGNADNLALAKLQVR
ncbi:MAG: DUF2723 domain-containing protein [Chloroflexi bacterium]|nr:DUF2723 domain-containing protein [Chloroflexota bacterium]